VQPRCLSNRKTAIKRVEVSGKVDLLNKKDRLPELMKKGGARLERAVETERNKGEKKAEEVTTT